MPAPRTARKEPPARLEDEGDVLYEIRRLHDCVHAVGERVDIVVTDVGHLRTDVAAHATDIAYLRGRTDAVATRVGAPEADATRKARPALAFISGWKAAAGIVAACFAGVTAAATAYPSIVKIASAVHTALLP